jgi:hypothetical protein
VGTAGYLAACENESTQLNHILQKIFSTSIRIAWQGKKRTMNALKLSSARQFKAASPGRCNKTADGADNSLASLDFASAGADETYFRFFRSVSAI